MPKLLARPFVLCLIVLFGVPDVAGAWHDRGHRATAHIAWDAMDAPLRGRIVAVLRQHPRFEEDFLAHVPGELETADDAALGRWLLGQASIWHDLIQTLDRDIQQQYNRSRWHYINRVVWLTDADEQRLASGLDHNMATTFGPPLRRDMNLIQALKGNLAIWRDAGVADADKAVALCWILHLTGDLHQPLHTVALFSADFFPSGDRGGNSIDVRWGDKTRNLHAVWDGLPTDMPDLLPSTSTLRSIDKDVVDDDAIDEWFRQHAALAAMFVYTADLKSQVLQGQVDGRPGTVELSHEYRVAAKSLARRQVNMAGYRISELLR